MSEAKTPKELDALVDKVLAYKPKPATKAAKGRKRKAKKAGAAPKMDGVTDNP